MEMFLQEIRSHGVIYGTLAGLSFLNVIVPMSGSSTTTPLLLVLTGNAQYAIALSSWVLMLNTGIGAFIFRQNIRKGYVRELLPASIAGAVMGALLLVSLPDWLVVLVLFGFSAHFLYKTLKQFLLKKKEAVKATTAGSVVGVIATFVSSFLQGTGLSGGGMRVSYLTSQGLKIEEVRGVGNLLNFLVFASAGLVRLGDGQVLLTDMARWTLLFLPILVAANFLGRIVVLRLPVKASDAIIMLTMVWIVADLFAKGVVMVLQLP